MRKWKQYLPVLAIVLFMALILGTALRTGAADPMKHIQFLDQSQNQPLIPYYDEAEDLYYLFLPSCTGPGDVGVTAESGAGITLSGGNTVYTLADLPLGQTADVQITRYGRTVNCRLRVEQCGNLPALFIDMQAEGLDWLHADKERKQTVFLRFVDETGDLMYQDTADISGRGNGTWEEQAKRPYNLSFSSAISLGPFENVSRLSLLAEYSDESKMRNALAYYCGRQLGIPYSTEYMHTDVYINGRYMGLYGLCTKYEYEKHIEEDGIEAVFEIGRNQVGNYFTAARSGRAVSVMHGRKDQLQQQVNRLEDALYEKDWQTSSQILDMTSFVRKWVMDEFLCNTDIGYASQYHFMDRSGRIYSMLPWDYDWTLGSSIMYFDPNQFHSLMTYRYYGYWGRRLMPNEAFYREAARILREEFTGEFLQSMKDYTLRLDELVDTSRSCDALRWKNERPFNAHPHRSGYEDLSDLCSFFCDFYQNRRDWLLRFCSAPEEFCLVEFSCEEIGFYLNYLIPAGDRLSEHMQIDGILPKQSSGYQLLSWQTADGIFLENVDVVTENIRFRAEIVPLEGFGEDSAGETLSDQLLGKGAELVILGLFSLLALAVFAALLRDIFRKRQIRR